MLIFLAGLRPVSSAALINIYQFGCSDMCWEEGREGGAKGKKGVFFNRMMYFRFLSASLYLVGPACCGEGGGRLFAAEIRAREGKLR